MSLESDWQARKDLIYTNLKALIDLGVPVETAKHLSAWTPVYAWNTFAGMQDGTGSQGDGLRDMLRIMVSRSPSRTNPDVLAGAVLDAGKLYAIFIPNVAELTITQVTFSLDGSPVHTEYMVPWDYAGTAPGGDANRISFVAGSYEVEATIIDAYGFFNLSASFEVE